MARLVYVVFLLGTGGSKQRSSGSRLVRLSGIWLRPPPTRVCAFNPAIYIVPGVREWATPSENESYIMNTVESLNKGHFGSSTFVLYSEAVLWWEVRIIIDSTVVISISAIASVL